MELPEEDGNGIHPGEESKVEVLDEVASYYTAVGLLFMS